MVNSKGKPPAQIVSPTLEVVPMQNLKNPSVQVKIPQKPLFEFKVMQPDPNKKYRAAPENVGNAGW